MELSQKAARFVIEALAHYRRALDQRLENDSLSEDEISDLTNDRHYLDAIQKDFEKHRDGLIRQPDHGSGSAEFVNASSR